MDNLFYYKTRKVFGEIANDACAEKYERLKTFPKGYEASRNI